MREPVNIRHEVLRAVYRHLNSTPFKKLLPADACEHMTPAEYERCRDAYSDVLRDIEKHSREPRYGEDFCVICDDKLYPHCHSPDAVAAAKKKHWDERLKEEGPP